MIYEIQTFNNWRDAEDYRNAIGTITLEIPPRTTYRALFDYLSSRGHGDSEEDEKIREGRFNTIGAAILETYWGDWGKDNIIIAGGMFNTDGDSGILRVKRL